MEGVGSTIFAAGNLHTLTTTLYGVLLMSGDGGKTWTEPNPRIEGAALDQVQFPDFQHGWASGVTVEPLARDPFFLVTADGGKTWRRRPLFNETRYGSIQQFWFDSAKSGQLIFERSQGSASVYEIYETANGGDTWTIKEAGSQESAAGESSRQGQRDMASSDGCREQDESHRAPHGARSWETGGELRRARRSLQMRTRASGIELELFRHLLVSIAEEMGVVLRKTSYSANIKERRDYSCAVYDARGEAVAMGDHMPVHLGAMPLSVRAVHGRVRSRSRATWRWSTIRFAAERICPTSPP